MIKKRKEEYGKENNLIVSIVILALILGTVVVIYRVYKMKDYEVIAHTLTEDIYYGPIVYNEELYFHTSTKLEKNNLSKALGLIEYDKQDYSLFLMRVFYPVYIKKDKNDELTKYLKSSGMHNFNYMKSSESEKQEYTKTLLSEDGKYIINNYTSDFGGFKDEIDYETVRILEETFGEIKYNFSDFSDRLNTFYVYREDELKKDYIGVIFKEGDNIYYGNKENIIEKVLKPNTNELDENSLYSKIYELIKK